jgi:hypothetical protein
LNTLTTLDLKVGDTIKSIPVAGEWGAGAYAVVLAHRPLDKAANRMPGRAIGLAWFAIDADSHKLDVSLAPPAKARPREPLTIPVRIKGLASGEEARVIVAAVDAGILNLTHYEAPDPRDFRSAANDHGNPRSLRSFDRWNARLARGNPIGRRCVPRPWQRTSDARAARPLFGRRQSGS